MSDLIIMNNIWEELGHERADLSCGKCVLIFLQRLGSEYYEYKEHANQETNPKLTVKKNAKKK